MAAGERILRVTIIGNAASAESAVSRLGGKMKLFAAVAGVAAVEVAKKTVDMASQYQSSMKLIQTQAGASASEVRKMSKDVLALAGPTATAPEELSTALYHIESTGARGAAAMRQLRVAAEGAKIGQANLEDVTNALNATIVSGIDKGDSYAGSMSKLNAIVGAGDMHMQDLADALSTGVVTSLHLAGVNLNEMGGALATFGDNNMRGAAAATQLRMAVQGMVSPSIRGAAALAKIHVGAQDLRKTLADKGLSAALTELHGHLEKFGRGKQNWNGILTDAFTKKAGTGLSTLMAEYDRYMNKTGFVAKSQNNLGKSFAETQQTFAFKAQAFKASMSALGIQIGTVLLPPLGKLASVGAKAVGGLASGMGPALDKVKGLFSGIGSGGGGGLAKTFGSLKQFGSELLPTFRSLGNEAAKTLGPALKSLGQAFTNDLLPGIRAMLPVLRPVVAFILRTLGGAIIGALHGAIDVLKGAFQVIGGLFKLIADIVHGHWGKLWGDVKTILSGALNIIKGLILIWWNAGILSVFRKGILHVITGVRGWWHDLEGLVRGGVGAVRTVLAKIVEVLTAPFRKAFGLVKTFVRDGWDFIKGDFSGGVGTVRSIIGRIVEVVTYPIRTAFTIAKGIVTGDWASIGRVFSGAVTMIRNVVGHIPGAILGVFRGAGTMLLNIGHFIIQGLINGIRNAAGGVVAEMGHVAGGIVHAITHPLSIFSPSRKMMQIGMFIMQGLAIGINKHSSKAQIAAHNAARTILRDVARTAAEAVQYGLEAGAAKTAAVAGKAATSVVSKLNSILSLDAKAGRHDPFLASVRARIAAIQSMADAVHTVTKRLTDAQKNLKASQSAAKQFRSGVYTSLSDAWSLSSLADTSSGAGIAASLGQLVQPMATFAAQIKQLGKDHLSGTFISQIANAGLTQGGAWASAILSNPSLIKSIDASQAQLDKYAHATAGAATDDMYAKQIADDKRAVREQTKALKDAVRALERVTQHSATQVHVEVKGDHKDARRLAKEIADEVRRELIKIGHRNGGRTGIHG